MKGYDYSLETIYFLTEFKNNYETDPERIPCYTIICPACPFFSRCRTSSRKEKYNFVCQRLKEIKEKAPMKTKVDEKIIQLQTQLDELKKEREKELAVKTSTYPYLGKGKDSGNIYMFTEKNTGILLYSPPEISHFTFNKITGKEKTIIEDHVRKVHGVFVTL